MDIEQGSEAFIPKMLSQDHLPLSFRFYDPIIKIVQRLMTEDKKDFFLLRCNTQLKVFRKVDAYNKFLESMGFKPSLDENFEKLRFKLQTTKEQILNYINVQDSLHSNSV